MRQGKNKRSRSNKDGDNESYMNVQADVIHSESYSRSHTYHISEDYRASSMSSRMVYPERDSALRLRRHDDEWRHTDPENDRYSYSDPYSRDDRSKYEDNLPRNSGGWREIDHTTYGQSRNDWSRRYDNGASSSSYPESSTWGMVNQPQFEHARASYPERWELNNPTRSRNIDDWGTETGRYDHRSDRRHQEWRQGDGQREKIPGRKFQSDSGWDSRRRERSTWNNHIPRTENPPPESDHHFTEDRSWEPAASWKSSATNDNHHQYQHLQQQHPPQHHQQPQRRGQNQNGQRQNHKHKRAQNYQRQKREWRPDDGDLNNWTKRDTNRTASKPSTNQETSRRKHLRSPSPSRSRSRSPTDSYRSFRSSRGRSRSRSISPVNKRQRRDSSPVTLRSPTPSERGMNNRQSRFDQLSSRSPSPKRSPSNYAGRRRSPTAISTSGSDRSRTGSPVAAMRSVHRLPTNPIPSDSASSLSTEPVNNGFTSRRGNETRNGKAKVNKQDRKDRDLQPHSLPNSAYNTLIKEEHVPINTLPPMNSTKSTPLSPVVMPPPASIPTAHVRLNPTAQEQTQTTSVVARLPESKIDIAGKPIRHVSARNAGFKPIGKVNSSLKKFFPGDDEDMDVPSEEPQLPLAPNIIHDTEASSMTSSPQVLGWETFAVLPQDSANISHYAPPQRGQSIRPNNRPVPPLDYIAPPENKDFPPSSFPAEPVASSHRQDEYPSVALPETRQITANEFHIPPSPHESQVSARHSSAHKDLYKILNQVGEGTFGKVYKAQNTVTGAFVALKRIRMEAERDGFPVTAMREIKLLQSLRHDNVVHLYEMMVSNGAVYMVFEYMDHDLTGVLSQTQFSFLDEHLKSLCHQMLKGLAYLHRKGVIHRDIKGSNILINNRGELKLADFGLARFYQKRRRADYTNRVITLWYRPPELLFGATVYGPEVDMWSAGCIMLELFTKKPIFQGADEIHQLEVIFKILGTPTLERWPDVVNFPWYELVKPQQAVPSRFRDSFQKWMSPAALDLAEQLLAYDPTQRITAIQALETPYFTKENPPASPPVGLIDLEGEWHELETKREKAKRKERKNVT